MSIINIEKGVGSDRFCTLLNKVTLFISKESKVEQQYEKDFIKEYKIPLLTRILEDFVIRIGYIQVNINGLRLILYSRKNIV
jgi:hypothetical protein